MFEITIDNESITTKSGRSPRTGRDYEINEQEAFVELASGERRVITVQHERATDAPLKAGVYKPGDRAGYVGKYGKLEVSTRARHWELVQPAKSVKAA